MSVLKLWIDDILTIKGAWIIIREPTNTAAEKINQHTRHTLLPAGSGLVLEIPYSQTPIQYPTIFPIPQGRFAIKILPECKRTELRIGSQSKTSNRIEWIRV
ncbi:Uncharacterised protein [Arcanobacterium haemolyticum]|nr:Uncharacterised protein [Arcanobacterium haemolyticum]